MEKILCVRFFRFFGGRKFGSCAEKILQRKKHRQGENLNGIFYHNLDMIIAVPVLRIADLARLVSRPDRFVPCRKFDLVGIGHLGYA